MPCQKTLKRPVSLEGETLWKRDYTKVQMYPAEPDEGIKLRRIDVKPSVTYPLNVYGAVVKNHRVILRPTTFSTGGKKENTLDFIEHLLSGLWGMGIDNVRVDVDGQELPFFEGSALPYVKAIGKAGVRIQDCQRNEASIKDSIIMASNKSFFFIRAAERLKITYVFLNLKGAMLQANTFSNLSRLYSTEIAPARTFAVGSFPKYSYPFEVRTSREFHYAYPSRFRYEMLRHKILDLVGDLALLGRRLNANILAVGTGHRETHEVLKLLKKEIARGELEHRLGTLKTPPPIPLSDG